ncbi:Phytocyanin domain containing protein [Trema orientale]|uniref:Phytocyanin domain containing protein n=1 Tax=Trema orientale TaxID=63057 RepID=A0A2P5CER9_TREOI|nr:Phytocyanin domain containing protein [Trema orientale]
MELMSKRDSFGLQFLAIFFCCFVLFSLSRSVEAYKNYTVGDSFGWYDNSEKPTVNYQKWADEKNFSLGDFLIFNTNTNHSVVQTYNETTYKLCDYEDASDKDTTQWSTADPSNTATRPITVPVPLLKEGKTYFFSGDYDGDQCTNGQRFAIVVAHGQGLPKSLKDPSTDESPGPVGPQSGDEEGDAAPDTIVPSNFNNPKPVASDDADRASDSSGSVSLSFLHGKVFGRQLCTVFMVCLGLIWLS